MCKSFYDRAFDEQDYFEWLIDIIGANRAGRLNYLLLLGTLHKIEFKWTIERDINRAKDGVDLRRRYVDDLGYDIGHIPDRPCSCLEMLVAMALRIEEDITGIQGDDHPERWFWAMIDNLNLTVCTDEHFNRSYVEQQVGIWLDRKFKKNGVGGIFPLKEKTGVSDQKLVEFWRQMCSYVNENYHLVG